MVIYIDLLFLFNFAINIIFLVAIEIIYKSKIKLWRIALGGLIGGLIVIVTLFDYNLYNLLKVTGGIIIGLVGLEKCSGKRNIIKYSSFYTLNFASVGLVGAFGINTHLLVFLALAVIIIVYFVESNKNLVIFTNRLKYNIIVNFDKTSLNLEGYLDTGNFSEYDNLPIIYIDEKYYPKELVEEAFSLVQVATVNNASFLRAYKPKKCVLVKNKEKIEVDVLVVFCNIDMHECLLNVKMLI